MVAAATPNANIFRIDFSHGNSAEYLLIENRHPTGNFDGGIPGGTGGRGGLAIWHIDDEMDENDDPGEPDGSDPSRHYKVAFIQADGQRDLEQGNNRGDAGDVFRSGHVDRLASDTTPSSNAYDGTEGPNINGISASGEVMTFRFGSGGENGGKITTPGTLPGFVRLTEANSHAANFSDDGNAATLLFDRMYAFAEGSDPLATTTASFILPLKGADGATKARVSVRGYVATANHGRAALALQAGGQLHKIDLKESQADSVERSDEAKGALDSLKSRVDSEQAGDEDDSLDFDYESEVECGIPAGGNFHLTFILTADQVGSPAENYALLWVDAIDITLGDEADQQTTKGAKQTTASK